MAEKLLAIGIDLGTINSCAVSQSPYDRAYDTQKRDAFTDTQRLKNLSFRHSSFEVVSVGGKPKIQVVHKGEETIFNPEEICSMVLIKIKNIIENYLFRKDISAVIAVPAYFNDLQRQVTKDACTFVGLESLCVINESTAAAIAYSLDETVNGERNVLIFNLGGGTFDVSIFTINGDIFEVKSTAKDTHLGGEDFDNSIVSHFVEEFNKKHKKDITSNKRALRRLKTSCERAKRTLSTFNQAGIEIDSFFEGIDFYASITRAKFEELNANLFQSTIESVAKAIRDAKMDKSQIHDIVLLGGSTCIPKIQNLLQDFFNGRKLKFFDIDKPIVALGAASQADVILKGYRSEINKYSLLLDVTPLSLGIETIGGIMTPLINRNTPLPAKKTQIFSTYKENQPSVLVQIYGGERVKTKDNKFLGAFVLSILPLTPRGVPNIEITFDVNYGFLTVTAGEIFSYNENKINNLNYKDDLNEEEIERMVYDAQKHRSEDEEYKNAITAKNDLESYCYINKSILKDKQNKTKIAESERDELLNYCNDIMWWLNIYEGTNLKQYEKVQNNYKAFCNPIIVELCQPEPGGIPWNMLGTGGTEL